MGFDYPILAEHAWAASRDDGRLQNSRVLLFMEGKRHKEPSSLQIKVQF